MPLIKINIKRQIAAALIAVIVVYSLSLSTVAAETGTPGTNGERVVLDPGFGYRSIFEPLANRVYKESPVTAYLPTRLPESDWHYYGLRSKLLKDGYEMYVYKTDQLPSDESSLPSALAADPDPKSVLFKIKAETYASAVNDGILLYQKDNWKFYSDQAAAGNKMEMEQLVHSFTNATKYSVPITGTTGFVTVAGTGKNRTYSAYWSFDGKVGYSFESTIPITDFISVLYSFRPVINLLDAANIVLLPVETRIDLQVGRKEAFEPRENKFITLSSKPSVISSSVYLPVADIVRIIQGQMQYIPKEHAVYLSENGYFNQLKLNVRTGEVYRKNVKIAKVPVHVIEGRTLVPLRFLTEQFGLKLDYDQTSKTVHINYSSWFTNNRTLEKAVKADYPMSVFSTGGPSFRFENSRIGSGGSWGYEQLKPPQGYNGLKYNIYKVGIWLLPGDNEFVYSDGLTGRIINTIPISSDLSPTDIPFRYGGSVFYDSLKMDIKLVANDGITWPSGYVETASYADITGAILSKGFNYSSLRMTYRQADSAESKSVSFPVAKDGSFSYRFKPEQGPGTYMVTLSNTPGAIVTFVIVVK